MDGSQRPATGEPDRSRGGDRLDSWKKIAAYLRRDVSTVQRWERREAMPVHRHLHDKLGSVFAFRSELDAWWEGPRTRLIEETTGVDRPSWLPCRRSVRLRVRPRNVSPRPAPWRWPLRDWFCSA